MKEKVIQTGLAETTFLSRLKSLCVKKELFDKGYNDKDIYVYKQKGEKFSIYKHVQHAGRTDGYIKDCLSCRYVIDEEKHVKVFYRFAKMKMLFPLSVVLFVVGFILFGYSVFEAIRFSNAEWLEIITSIPFLVLGCFTLFGSKKEREGLENRLFHICSVDPIREKSDHIF